MNATPSGSADLLARVDEHRGILTSVANAYCRDRSSREDLLQETIMQLWRSYPHYEEKRVKFSTWMYRIALNVAISFYRAQSRHTSRAAGGEELLAHVADPAPIPDDVRDERLDLVYAFIDKLDPLNRAVMLLYLDDRPYAEIAEILGISETNVGTKIGRIKAQLKREVATSPT